MKRLSIKARVTAWYTGLLVLLLGLVVVYLISFLEQVSIREMQEELLNMVADTVKAVQFNRDDELDDEDIDFYRNGVSVFIYDTGGHLLAPKVNQGIQIDSILEDQAVKRVDNGRERWLVHDLYAQQDGKSFWVRGAVSLSGTVNTLRGMAVLALIGVPLFAAIAALGGWWITRRAFGAVGQIAETADAITQGSELSQRVTDDGSGDELSRLGHTINSMLERLQRSFDAERQFASDASHELRTPTAIILSQTEYLLSGEMGESERREGLHIILRQAKKMTTTISQLLMLARAENGRFEPCWEKVDFSALCEAVAQEMEEAARAAGLALTIQVEPRITLRGDETLLVRLLTNLLTNALAYNRLGGNVGVSLRRTGEGGCTLTVADTGQGIPREALPHIWNRFYRVEAAHNSEGTGLGLSMVRWIAELHGGRAQVQSEVGVGSAFTVTFPIKN